MINNNYNKFLREKQMRDILNLLDSIINESRGLSGRDPGAVYKKSDSEDKITFQNLTFYPQVGQYDTKEEVDAAFDKIQQQVGQPIKQINQSSNKNKAFAVATFDTAVGPRYLAKFAQSIKPVHSQNTFFQTKDIPGGFSQVDARGSKENVGYKPSQVLKNFKSQTPATIMSQIQAKFGADSDEYRAAEIIISATSFPVSVPAGNMDFTGFRDYFCEMLQPIVLINDQPVSGNAADAAKTFLGGTYSDCIVSFDDKPGGKLYDSLLINPKGKQIKLSSKGATGAMASSVNLLRSVEELESAGMTQFRENYADTIAILEVINKGTHNSAPLELAVELGIISATEISQVLSLESSAGVKDFDIDNTKLSDNLKQIYKDRTAADTSKIVPLNHLVSSIAYKVCNEINLKTNFSEAAADILNHSAFVQMYTEAKKSKDQFVIQGFKTIWPSKLFTEVTLEAQKSYSSTSSSAGKLVFNINKTPKEISNVETGPATVPLAQTPAKTSVADLDTLTQKRSGITARKGISEEKKLGTKEILGRKRRR
jgi:hypothetical protein